MCLLYGLSKIQQITLILKRPEIITGQGGGRPGVRPLFSTILAHRNYLICEEAVAIGLEAHGQVNFGIYFELKSFTSKPFLSKIEG